MHTFYVPPSQINADIATITGSEQHHLRNVLRITPGETLRIIDGQGQRLHCRNSRHTHKPIFKALRGIQTHAFQAPRLPTLTLFQGLPKNDKMELILQKTTELGVTQIVPLHSERALQKPSQNRYERWHRVLISATKQCKRAWLPELCKAQQFEASLSQLEKFSRCLLLSPHAGGPAHQDGPCERDPLQTPSRSSLGLKAGFLIKRSPQRLKADACL